MIYVWQWDDDETIRNFIIPAVTKESARHQALQLIIDEVPLEKIVRAATHIIFSEPLQYNTESWFILP